MTGALRHGGLNVSTREAVAFGRYNHLTLVGHSNGGDVLMYLAKQHPEIVSKVITLDNLRVPFVPHEGMKILSFRSKDPNFKADPGVLPPPGQIKASGIDIVDTGAQHNDMSDRGPDLVKERIRATLIASLGIAQAVNSHWPIPSSR
jgi:pimeloyl-ACP methyl ester carboxylesterase